MTLAIPQIASATFDHKLPMRFVIQLRIIKPASQRTVSRKTGTTVLILQTQDRLRFSKDRTSNILRLFFSCIVRIKN
jgi:hypothetical protein